MVQLEALLLHHYLTLLPARVRLVTILRTPGITQLSLPLNIGISDASRRTSDMPLYTFKKMPSGPTIQTTDPGRALISGKFDDIGKFKGPTLRGLAARAPYFHNGAAKDLDAVIDFYDERFQMNLTPEEHKDLVAFLRTL
jgi:cytochrome c peroxidase